MDSENRAHRMEEEIAEIEDRRRKRNLFLALGGIVGAVLLFIVVVGIRERARIAEIEARPKSEPVELGTLVGTTANTAVFARGDRLSYVEGIGDADVSADTRFARAISYDAAGTPDTLPSDVYYWTLAESDSLPYILEPVTNPLLGVTPSDYQELDLGSMRASDYGSGGPGDWRSLEQEGQNVRITGEASREDSSVYLTADSVRARLQGIEGLAGVDSLEVAWAIQNSEDLTAFGRITSTPRRPTDNTLFVMTINSVHPPASMPAEAPSAPDAGGGDLPPDTTAPDSTP